MLLIWFLLIGLIAGWLAGMMMKGSGYGMIGDIVIGIVGAVVGGYVLSWLGLAAYGLIGALITATIGAVILIFLIHLVKRV
jgi:uncharacterized membrane protein YeaQ/YmgE (transglycosylase-associated protein family)